MTRHSSRWAASAMPGFLLMSLKFVSVMPCPAQGLGRDCASFETPSARAPQDEAFFLMPSITDLMLRSASARAEARLEARRPPLQHYFSVAAIWRISSGVWTPASGVLTFRYLPIARPP